MKSPVRGVTRRPSRTARASGPAAAVLSALVFLVVAFGWLLRARNPVTPDSGIGYVLGICGGATLLVLTLYSARKHLRFMRRWVPLSHWFRLHMILGVLGPVLILFHCNFRLGAPNSNVALASMLVVAGSGVVGRYIYTRISHGLYGARATLEELHAELDVQTHTLGERLPAASRAAARLSAFAAVVQAPRRSVAARVIRPTTLPLRAMAVRRRVLRDIRADLAAEAAHRSWDKGTQRANEKAAREIVGTYITALVKEAQFTAYERVFSLWHALHIPLFVMLLVTGIVHVVAVHMY